MGVLALLATILQARHDETLIAPSFFAEFYRFLRYLLIFKFVENIILNCKPKDVSKFFYSYTIIGALVIILSFLEFYGIGSFQTIIVNLYYVIPDQTFDENFEEFGRLLGVLGNSNTTAIFLTSTLVYPTFLLTLKKSIFLNKSFLIVYILLASFVILFMTSSRTSVLIGAFLFIFIFILSISKAQNLTRLLSIIAISLIVGGYLYVHYKDDVTLSDRVMFVFEGKNSTGEKVGFIESLGRTELWQERINTFEKHAHPLALFTGMGYTKVYKDYSDNGLLTSFMNGGLIGLALRLIIYYLVFRYVFRKTFMNHRKLSLLYRHLALGTVSLVFIFWELTADLIEHIKIGQVFYLFFSAAFVYRAHYFRLKQKKAHPQDLYAANSTELINTN
jgi:O-antigen ligase